MTVQIDAGSRQAVKSIFDEVHNSMTRAAAERDLQKDLFDKLKKQHNIPPKVARLAAKVRMGGSLDEVQDQVSDVEQVLTAINQ